MLPREDPSRFAALLRQLRLDVGLTQEELSERALVSVRSIQALERGDSHPHKDTAERLAQALKLRGDPFADFLTAARKQPRSTPPIRGLTLVVDNDVASDSPAIAVPGRNLPQPASSFIGRDREMSEVERLFATTRVLTLTGAGGCGKTRLALRLAATLRRRFPDGVWLVEFGPLAEPALVPQAVASTLQIREHWGRPPLELVVELLRTKQLLLVLDNCEHVVEAVARLVDTLVRACPRLYVLSTSQDALRLAAEAQYRVPSLAVPDLTRLPAIEELARFEGVQLFCERAQAVQPDFTLTEHNQQAVAEICCRLDGLPLAIELAAARTRMLTPEQIARRLDDRFRLLVGGERTAPSRQQTLRGLIDWSYELLADKERQLLARLAVFAGGFTLEAVEGVCAGEEIDETEVIDLLATLVDRSLVVRDEQDGESRYRLLETIRVYAGRRLAETSAGETLHRRHVEWYLALTEQLDPASTSSQDAWLGQLALEEDNLRAALAWCVAHDPGSGLRLAGSLWRHWDSRGFLTEGARWLEGLLAPAAGPGEAPVKVLGETAEAAVVDGRTVEARSLARALMALGWLAHSQGDSRSARTRLEAGLAIFRTIGDGWGIRWMLVRLAFLILSEGDVRRARELVEETLALARASGDLADVAWVLNRLSIIAQYEGDLSRASALLDESLRILEQTGDKRVIAWSVGDLGNLATSQGDYARAERLLQDSLAALREIRTKDGIYWRLLQLGHLARCQGHVEEAQSFLEDSLSVARDIAGKLEIGLSLESLAYLSRLAANRESVLPRLRESLQTLVESGQAPAIAHCLWLLGIQTVDRGAPASGVRLIAAATAHALFGTLVYPPERADSATALATARAVLGEQTFTQIWREGRALSLDQAVAYASPVRPE
jgi:non-specific serine/threonine protein kinase